MVIVPSTGASRYHNCCIDGGTSPEYFGYNLVHVKWASVVVWMFWRRDKPAFARNRTPDFPVRSLVNVVAEFSKILEEPSTSRFISFCLQILRPFWRRHPG
jgi:hypothetical protein